MENRQDRIQGPFQRRAVVVKELEAQGAAVQLGLNALDEERKQWKAIYSLHHERGGKHGAEQEPYWIVIAKATFAALFALLAVGWFIFFISPFFVLFRWSSVGRLPLLQKAMAHSKPSRIL